MAASKVGHQGSGLQQRIQFAATFQCGEVIEAADVTGHDAAEVAKAYFAVGSALDLPWYLQQISDLPVANNWQAQAREAFRDDIDLQQRAITISALSRPPSRAAMRIPVIRLPGVAPRGPSSKNRK